MPIRTYFSRNNPRLRMTPESDMPANAITWTGPVLQGTLSTTEAFKLDQIAAHQNNAGKLEAAQSNPTRVSWQNPNK